MLTLTEFLLARIAEDEAAAKAATPGPWYWEPESGDPWPQADQSLCTRRREPGQGYDPSVLSGWGYDASGIEGSDEDRAHIARHDPTRALAEAEAKRRIVETCGIIAGDPALPSHHLARHVLADLALPYADHDDYDKSWRP